MVKSVPKVKPAMMATAMDTQNRCCGCQHHWPQAGYAQYHHRIIRAFAGGLFDVDLVQQHDGVFNHHSRQTHGPSRAIKPKGWPVNNNPAVIQMSAKGMVRMMITGGRSSWIRFQIL